MEERRWLALRIRFHDGEEGGAPDPTVVRRVAGLLVGEGASAVREEGDALVTHLLEPDRPRRLLERLRRKLVQIDPSRPPTIESWWEEERDWSAEWRRGLEPRRVGDRVVLAPPGREVSAGAGVVVVRIEPGMAFGSGDHGSTRGVLRLMAETLRPGDRVLDAGTGSGVLAAAAALLGAERVVGVDVDPDAVAVARENLEENGVAGRVRLLEARVDTAFLALLAPVSFDLVAANLSARALRPLLRPFRERVEPDGVLVIGGILEEEAPGFRGAVLAAGWEVDGEVRDEGWWSARLRRPEAGSS